MDDTVIDATSPVGTVPVARGAASRKPADRTWSVLCVDDEPNILAALRRTLRPAGAQVLCAASAPEALALLEARPADLVISDMRMPGMDGAQLLARVAERWPDTRRLLLTGHADVSSAVSAINEGGISRYLTKPWNDDELRDAVRQNLQVLDLQREKARLEALTQAQNTALAAANAELEARVAARTADLSAAHERLKSRYLTSIKVFSGLLELRNGQLAGHGRAVAETARRIGIAAGLDAATLQHLFVAGLLHDIGLIGMPDALLGKPVSHLSPEEKARYCQHPLLGEQALMPLEDMAPVAALVRAHHERPDGQGYPAKLGGAAIPPAAHILAIASAFEELRSGHLTGARLTVEEARTVIRHGRGTQYDAEMVDVFLHVTEPDRPVVDTHVSLGSADVEPDMVLARDLVSSTGVLMLTAGHVLTAALIRRIREFEAREGGTLHLHIRPRA